MTEYPFLDELFIEDHLQYGIIIKKKTNVTFYLTIMTLYIAILRKKVKIKRKIPFFHSWKKNQNCKMHSQNSERKK